MQFGLDDGELGLFVEDAQQVPEMSYRLMFGRASGIGQRLIEHVFGCSTAQQQRKVRKSKRKGWGGFSLPLQEPVDHSGKIFS